MLQLSGEVPGEGRIRRPPIPPQPPLSPQSGDPDPISSDEVDVYKLGALLGVTEGPGTLLIKGPAARQAAELTGLIGGVEVVGLEPALVEEEETEGVSRMVSQPGIPFSSSTFMGILFSGEVTEMDLEEGARVVRRLGRVAVLDASPGTVGWVEACGLEILLREGGVLVAQRVLAEKSPLITLRGL